MRLVRLVRYAWCAWYAWYALGRYAWYAYQPYRPYQPYQWTVPPYRTRLRGGGQGGGVFWMYQTYLTKRTNRTNRTVPHVPTVPYQENQTYQPYVPDMFGSYLRPLPPILNLAKRLLRYYPIFRQPLFSDHNFKRGKPHFQTPGGMMKICLAAHPGQ